MPLNKETKPEFDTKSIFMQSKAGLDLEIFSPKLATVSKLNFYIPLLFSSKIFFIAFI